MFSKMPSWVATVLFCIVFFAVIGGILYLQECSYTSRIEAWSKEHGYSVEKIEIVFWNDGPFWSTKNESIRRAYLSDASGKKKISFFKFSLFGMRQAWKE